MTPVDILPLGSVKFTRLINTELCRDNPDSLIVFADVKAKHTYIENIDLRVENNTLGIPVRNNVKWSDSSLLSDKSSEISRIKKGLDYVLREYEKGKDIILHVNELSAEYNLLKNKAPECYKLIHNFYEYFRNEIELKYTRK